MLVRGAYPVHMKPVINHVAPQQALPTTRFSAGPAADVFERRAAETGKPAPILTAPINQNRLPMTEGLKALTGNVLPDERTTEQIAVENQPKGSNEMLNEMREKLNADNIDGADTALKVLGSGLLAVPVAAPASVVTQPTMFGSLINKLGTWWLV